MAFTWWQASEQRQAASGPQARPRWSLRRSATCSPGPRSGSRPRRSGSAHWPASPSNAEQARRAGCRDAPGARGGWTRWRRRTRLRSGRPRWRRSSSCCCWPDANCHCSGTPAVALAALREADQRVARLEDPALRRVRGDQRRDRGGRSGRGPRPEGVALRLASLARRVEGLPLRASLMPEPRRQAATLMAASGWERVPRGSRRRGRRLFRIRRSDAPAAPLLAPDETFFLYRNVELDLKSARLAVLARDPDNYAASLDSARPRVARTISRPGRSRGAGPSSRDGGARGKREVAPEWPEISRSVELLRAAGAWRVDAPRAAAAGRARAWRAGRPLAAGRPGLRAGGHAWLDAGDHRARAGHRVDCAVPADAPAGLGVRAPRHAGRAVGEFRARRSQRHLDHAFAAIAEGKWSRGERLLGRAARGPASLAGYLSAARAAQEQDAIERRDEWLRLAYEADPAAAPAVLLTQAELQLDQGQLEEGAGDLRQLEGLAPGHPRGLACMRRCSSGWRTGPGSRPCCRSLRHRKALDGEACRPSRSASPRRTAGRRRGRRGARNDCWQALRRDLRRHPACLPRPTRRRPCGSGAADAAEPVILKRALKSDVEPGAGSRLRAARDRNAPPSWPPRRNGSTSVLRMRCCCSCGRLCLQEPAVGQGAQLPRDQSRHPAPPGDLADLRRAAGAAGRIRRGLRGLPAGARRRRRQLAGARCAAGELSQARRTQPQARAANSKESKNSRSAGSPWAGRQLLDCTRSWAAVRRHTRPRRRAWDSRPARPRAPSRCVHAQPSSGNGADMTGVKLQPVVRRGPGLDQRTLVEVARPAHAPVEMDRAGAVRVQQVRSIDLIGAKPVPPATITIGRGHLRAARSRPAAPRGAAALRSPSCSNTCCVKSPPATRRTCNSRRSASCGGLAME
jgi:hypothetical protein